MAKSTLPAMITADNVDIDVGMKVYSVELSEAWQTRTYSCFINESTVIIDNRRGRFFVHRCAKGCETKVKMQDGCSVPSARIYADKSVAEARAKEMIAAKVLDNQERIADRIEENKKSKEKIAELKKLKIELR